MIDKKSFLLFNDLKEPIKSLSDEDAGKLFKTILEYQNGGIIQEPEGAAGVAFAFIKQQLDRSADHYQGICERNRINGAKGGRPKNPEEPKEPSGLFGNPVEPKITLPDPDPHPKNKKDKKHQYGEYSHVLLTDIEYQKLQTSTSNAKEWIRTLDEYIQTSGKKYKDHYLTMLNWYRKDNKIAPAKLKSTLIPLDSVTKEEKAETARQATKLKNKLGEKDEIIF